jgi:dipeptidyl aminopeptidase/acylaminoacyl peptidase
MTRARSALVFAAAVALLLSAVPGVEAQRDLAPGQFISAAYPLGLVSADEAEQLAWIAYDEGKRNVYTAASPDFAPLRVTHFLEDDGIDLTDVQISADGSMVAFVRGHNSNRQGWVANPLSDPDGAERAIWAARTDGSGAWRVAEAAGYELSPDGRWVVFARDGQIYRASTAPERPASPRDRADEPFVIAWGNNGSPRWSPDGSKISFVSNRTDHSYVVIYDVATRALTYMAPDVDFDTSPTWSEDGSTIAFVRRPGLPFGRQAQQGSGGVGLPPGPAFQPGQQGRRGGGGRQGGRGGGRGAEAGPGSDVPGLMRATFRGGYTMSIWVGDPATGEAEEVWHTTPDEQVFTGIRNIQWAAGRVIFNLDPPGDEWDRYHSIDLTRPNTDPPTLLTTTDGIIEGADSVALSKDGRTMFYTTNHGDIDRRHVFAVPTAGGEPKQVSLGNGIETYPVALASGTRFAALTADWNRPLSVGVINLADGEQTVIFPSPLPSAFPVDAHVVPEAVTLTAEDDFEFYNQVWVPADLEPGERRPAMIFVHGGPVRQMLLGYHYRHFYHMAYGVNQWLASRGYVVMSVNYRSGVGYGNSFRRAPNTGGRGNAEYLDVLAAGKYLQSRPDVDPDRIGIWGLSYGGVLTGQALARNSDIFKVGIDLAGVHLWGSSLDPNAVSYQSSVIGAIDGWTSPVLLIHGDDDRNVAFQQTTGLVQLLRARDVEYELIVFPDDVHDSLVHSRWVYTFDRMDQFLKKHMPVR